MRHLSTATLWSLALALVSVSANAQLSMKVPLLAKPALAVSAPAAPLLPSSKPMPAALGRATPVKSLPTPTAVVAPPATTSSTQPLSTWPFRFHLKEDGRESTIFAVTQAGPIRLSLQATGVPLTLSLRRPDGRVLEQKGQSQIVIDTVADTRDIGLGLIWSVSIRPASENPNPAAARPTGGSAPIIASGTVNLQAPAVDGPRATSAYQQLQATALDKGRMLVLRQMASLPTSPVRTGSNDSAPTNYSREVATRHMGELNRIRSLVRPSALGGLQATLETRLTGGALPPVRTVTSYLPGALVTAAATPGTTAPRSQPRLSTVSKTSGDPGTPLILQGSDFGATPGEIFFSVGADASGASRVVSTPVPGYGWSDNQIELTVPMATGVPGPFDGVLWVKRPDGAQSGALPFRFEPAYETRTVYTGIYCPDSKASREGRCTVPDSRLAPNPFGRSVSHMTVSAHSAMFWGYKGDDEYWVSTRLKNGWLMHSAEISTSPIDFYLPHVWPKLAFIGYPEFLPDTDRPYVKVHWWMEPAMDAYFIYYAPPILVIKRPVGLPCSTNPCEH